MGIVPQPTRTIRSREASAGEEVDKVQQFSQGYRLAIDYDSTVFIERSISRCISTLYHGWFSDFGVVHFIGQLVSYPFPAVTVPVSLISAFMAACTSDFLLTLIT